MFGNLTEINLRIDTFNFDV